MNDLSKFRMRTVSEAEYEKLLAASDVIEQDGHGIKVVRLPDGNFLKTFWVRRWFSSRWIYPEWLRFTLHAEALRRRGIPTVEVLQTLRIPHLKRTGVMYRPLPGCTLRQVAAGGMFDAALAERLGGFIARLHRKGVHFHSLHLGNVLLCPDGAFGLIDISNMKIFPWPLWANTRIRNFAHLVRDPGDATLFADAVGTALLKGYSEGTNSGRTRYLRGRIRDRYGALRND